MPQSKSYNSGPEGQGELTANVLAVLAPGAAASSVAKAPEIADAANAASKVDKVATADAKIAEAVDANASKTASTPEQSAKATTYQTYTKTNPDTGEVYTGRTSGTGTPEENVAARDDGHHMTKKGFGPAQLDKSSSNPDAIRGREQQGIDKNGGAKSGGGTSGNAIRGVSKSNPKAEQYKQAANKEFGN